MTINEKYNSLVADKTTTLVTVANLKSQKDALLNSYNLKLAEYNAANDHLHEVIGGIAALEPFTPQVSASGG